MKPISSDSKGLRILIIEDQSCVGYLLEDIKRKFGSRIKDFSQDGDVRIVNSYAEAQRLALSSDFDYHIVFLDNRLVLERHEDEQLDRDFGEEWKDQGYKIMDEFSSKTLYDYENGYQLIQALEAKGAIVVGTSSMDKNELRNLGIPKEPSLKCSKAEIPDAVVESIFVQLEKFKEKDETLKPSVEQQFPQGKMR